MKIPNCPNCRTCNTTFINATAQGTALMYFDGDGTNTEVYADKTWFKPSKTIRCDDCAKIRKDLYFDMDSGVRIVQRRIRNE